MLHLFGNPNAIALIAERLYEAPLDPYPEASATWMCTTLIVQHRNLTAHVHSGDPAIHPGLNWPGIYLARWLTHHWETLFTEPVDPEVPAGASAIEVAQTLTAALDDETLDLDDWNAAACRRDAFVRAHAMRAVPGGGLMPDIWVHREGDHLVVEWTNASSGDVHFIVPAGRALIPVETANKAFSDWLAWVSGQVDRRGALAPFSTNRTTWHREIRS